MHYNSYDTIITVESAWWLLMTWRLFGTRACAIIMMTQADGRTSVVSQRNAKGHVALVTITGTVVLVPYPWFPMAGPWKKLFQYFFRITKPKPNGVSGSTYSMKIVRIIFVLQPHGDAITATIIHGINQVCTLTIVIHSNSTHINLDDVQILIYFTYQEFFYIRFKIVTSYNH